MENAELRNPRRGAAAVHHQAEGGGFHGIVEDGYMLVSHRCAGVDSLPHTVLHPGLYPEFADALACPDILTDDTAAYRFGSGSLHEQSVTIAGSAGDRRAVAVFYLRTPLL